MKVRALAAVFVVLGLALPACGKKKDTAAPIPPPAPNKLTSPEAEDQDDADEGEEDEELGDEEEGGFGSPKAAPKAAPKDAPKDAPKAAPEPAPKASPKAVARLLDVANELSAHAKGKTRAWDRLAEMTDTFGHRLSGSKALEDAIDWSVATMKADGLANVRREKVMVPKWVRGKESLRVVAPFDRELRMLGLGMSVGTKGTLRAEVVVVDNVADIAKQPKGALGGKIVLINQKMPAYDTKKHESHYGGTVVARTTGASEAAKAGALAVLVRSVTATSLDTPHTGSLSYAEGVKKIPAAAVTHEAADTIARAAKRGKVKLALAMGAKDMGEVPSANAIGELVGREKPEEIVVIGGHIDSWDVGTGASDDGAGCLIAMEAALLLKELDLVPRRTIRVVLFTNEENGLKGGTAYFQAHGKEVHAGAIESDSGSGAPWGFSIKTDDKAAEARVMSWRKAFAPVKADHFFTGWGGADISPLTKAGVLSMALAPDGSRYFDLHHSPADTVDKIDPAHIEGNAAAMALMAYALAEL